MDYHNKVIKPYGGNIKILSNIALEFKIPQNLDELLYISQVFQAETIKIAVEHFRSNRDRCKGSTYWQVNDNYPVISWSSIDYYGRWKALHYVAKRFYSPVILASHEIGLDCQLCLCNETKYTFNGLIKAEIRDINSNIIKSLEKEVSANAFSAKNVLKLSISDLVDRNGAEENIYMSLNMYNRKEREYFVSYKLLDDRAQIISSGTQLFTPHKYFKFKEANISAIRGSNDRQLLIKTNVFSKSITLTTLSEDVLFDDICFDLLPGEIKEINIVKGIFKFEDLKIYSVNNMSSIS